MNRRQFLSGSLALAALAATQRAHATPLTPEEAAWYFMESIDTPDGAVRLMRHMVDSWDSSEATRLPMIPITRRGPPHEWRIQNGNHVRGVEPTDPEWNQMYWQWRIMRTVSMNGQTVYLAAVAPVEFNTWSGLAIGYVL